MFPTGPVPLSSHMGLPVPASWKCIKTVADVPVESPERTFQDKPEQDGEDKTSLSSPAIPVAEGVIPSRCRA